MLVGFYRVPSPWGLAWVVWLDPIGTRPQEPNNSVSNSDICRGYYMAARRYEIFSSSVEKYSTSEYIERVKYFQHEKRNFVSPCNVLLIISTPVEMPNHFTSRKLAWYFTGVYLSNIIDHTFNGFTGVIAHAGCWENTRKAWTFFECSSNIPSGLSRR